ncbi:MAG: protein kinase, partial [Anaerolineae bacterium]|nr:protein kinase [Anaerolineae bacterium]
MINNSEIGKIINQRYRLDQHIGEGGMGTVFKAHDLTLERDVAVKLLSNSGLGTEGRARLLQEARLIAKLDHPNIVTVYDAGEVEEQPYIVMTHIEGVTLNNILLNGPEHVAEITKQVCEALSYAHRQEIVHRDLKPENIIVRPNGKVMLMDFGLARSVASRLTMEGTITGTVFYMAPEQAMGQPLDLRTDLYALGVVMYEMLTGQLPFEDDDPIAVISQHIHAPVVPPRARVDNVPTYLDRIVVQLLSKAAADRPKSAQEVIQALDMKETAQAASNGEVGVLDRIVRGRMVGREQEVAQTRRIWEKASGGSGQLLLITGEPGIGKTRLVRETIARAEVGNGEVLLGACYADSGAPYAPFAQMVRHILKDGMQNGFDFPQFVLADLLVIAPDLRPYFPDIPENPKLDPQLEVQRIFQSFVTFCEQISAENPVLMIVDDIHWADSGTLNLLRHLARNIEPLRLMIVATYREVELGGAAILQDMLHDYQREPLTSRIKLARLDRDAARRLLETLFAEEVSNEFLDGIYQETEGNPFFIEEVCKALVESGELYYADGEWHRPSNMADLKIPQSVMVAIQSRVNNFPDEHRDILVLAAVLGREFDFDSLNAAAGKEEDALISSLELAERTQLIEEISPDHGTTFAFSHALIPAAIIETLSSLRLRRLHGQVAEAVIKVRPKDYETIALHYTEAGNLEAGLKYALLAGERAFDAYAGQEAIRFFSLAEECAEGLGDQDQLIGIYERLGDLYTAVGPFSMAIDYFEKILETDLPVHERAKFKSRIAGVHMNTGDFRGVKMAEEARRSLDPETQPEEIAHVLLILGRYKHLATEYSAALEFYHEGREIAEGINNNFISSNLYAMIAGVYQHLTNFEESIRWANASIKLGQENDIPFAVAIGYEFLAEDYGMMGYWQKGLEAANQEEKIARKFGSQDRIGWLTFARGVNFHGSGRLVESTRAFDESIRIARQIGNVRLEILGTGWQTFVILDRGDFQLAQ